MLLLEDVQARHTNDLDQQSAAVKELRTTCHEELASICKEFKSEVETMQVCFQTISDAVSLPTAVPETVMDPCEVRFDGVPNEVDASAYTTYENFESNRTGSV
uniref:Uncharacterized protein n=1 Tax=Trichogramma kaykai TaxID=54128 RepID=A0ABD2WHF4_9HYME